MPHQLWVTALLNKYLAGAVNAIMGVLHLQPAHPQAPITDYVAMQLVVFVLLVLTFALVRSRASTR
jgi:F-type H+-transporting ATPase subunit a